MSELHNHSQNDQTVKESLRNYSSDADKGRKHANTLLLRQLNTTSCQVRNQTLGLSAPST